MTRTQFEEAVEKLDDDDTGLSKIEQTLQEMIESEHVPGLRMELMASKQALHSARLCLLVAYQRLKVAVAAAQPPVSG